METAKRQETASKRDRGNVIKIYRVEYAVQRKVDGEKEWTTVWNGHIDVAAPSVKRALKAAELYAPTPSRFFDSDTN